MLQLGKGAMFNNSSIYGFKASDVGHAPYCVSQFGVIGLTQSGAVDYAKRGIRINVVLPGFTHSEMVDPHVAAAPDLVKALVNRHSASNRLADASETAEAIAWLCSDAASFVNGAVLPVDGGAMSRLY